jgi:hypothetical protein
MLYTTDSRISTKLDTHVCEEVRQSVVYNSLNVFLHNYDPTSWYTSYISSYYLLSTT